MILVAGSVMLQSICYHRTRQHTPPIIYGDATSERSSTTEGMGLKRLLAREHGVMDTWPKRPEEPKAQTTASTY
eukprot:5904114-Amphidinium_carterae.1